MTGKDRGTLLSGTGAVVALVVVLGVAGSITSAAALGGSAATGDYRPADAAAAAVDSVVETAVLGTAGIVGAPKDDRAKPNGKENGNGEKSARGANAGGVDKTDSPRSDGNGANAGRASDGADGAPGESDGASGTGDDASEKSDSAPGESNDAPGKSDSASGAGDDAPGNGSEAPGRNGTAQGQSTAGNRTADERRGPPETVPATVNAATRGNGNGNGPPQTVVNASVGEVRANERARIGLEARRDALVNRSNASDVAITAMELTPTRNGSFTLNVTAAERIDGSPEFVADDGTEAMTHIRVNHSISNDELNGTVDIDFRVSAERLENESVAPEDVALYRYENGSWTELPTTVVNETETAVLFRAESPGLSEFAAGAKRARFSMETVGVSAEEIVVGDDLQVHVTIANDGGADGEFSAQLLLDGDVVAERSLTIAAGGQRQTLFDHRVDDSGEYEVRVNDVVAGTVVVRQSVDAETESTATMRETTEPTESAAETASDDSSTTVSGTEVPEPIFHPTALVFVVVAALVSRFRRRG